MNKVYRMCVRCIMDTTDPDIWFDGDGVCSHCHRYEDTITSENYCNKKRPGALEALLKNIKRKGANNRYDCVIGVSGGVDSTYVAYLVKKFGMRPLAVHLDNGWDSELAVSNIEKALKELRIDLYTYVLNWDEFRDLQLSFLKSDTPDSEIPTDHAILAALYIVAARHNIKFILCGNNTATEGGGVIAWSQGHGDWGYIKSVHQLFGTRPLKSFPHYSPLMFIYYTLVKRIRWIQILDYFEYDKKKALEIIQKELNWRSYANKHGESIYTRFYQGYILPKKFGFDKKRLHLSSLIWSGQLSREEALRLMDRIEYPAELQEEDKEYAIKKIGISNEEFEQIMKSPPKKFLDYPSYKKILCRHKWLISIYHSLCSR